MKKPKQPIRINIPKLIRDVIETLKGETTPALQPIPIPVKDQWIKSRRNIR
jgi:hypothetical protein